MQNINVFETIYTANFERMKRFAYHYVLNKEDAENIVQDVFEVLWLKKEELEEDRDYFGYLLYSVKNKCIDFLRKEMLIRSAHDELHKQNIKEKALLYSLEQFNPIFETEKDLMHILEEAIASLPPQCKQIFYKSKIQGKKHQEIAKEMQISVNTIETQMSIAYKKLRIILKDLYPILFLFIY